MGTMVEILGWVSSVILVLTIATQLHRQWSAGTSTGVSVWLFVGNCVASCGFFAYSLLIHNWVFVVTNGLLAVEAMLGLALVYWHRRRERRHGPAGAATASG